MRRAALRQSELCAIELLCKQNFESIFDLTHLSVERLVLPVSAVFDSFSSYCEKTGAPKSCLCGAGTDGLTVRRDGQYIILYNDQVGNERRRAFTLAHEVGHILLSHAGERPEVEEREANAFAASLLCPAIAARYLAHRDGSPLTAELLCANFFLSAEAAKTRLRDLRRPAPPPADTEIALLLSLFGKMPERDKSMTEDYV